MDTTTGPPLQSSHTFCLIIFSSRVCPAYLQRYIQRYFAKYVLPEDPTDTGDLRVSGGLFCGINTEN